MIEQLDYPPSFEVVVGGRAGSAHALAEIHHYRWTRPEHRTFRSNQYCIDMVLSNRPPQARGRYLETGPGQSRALGSTICIPARHAMQGEWMPGEQTSICCLIDDGLIEGEGKDDGFEWDEKRLAASLDLRSEFVRVTLSRMAQEALAPGFSSGLLIESLSQALLIDLQRHFQSIADTQNSLHRLSALQMRRVQDMLEAEGPQPGIAQLAAECGLSNRHFSRLFLASTGKTVGTYAAERRIARAKAMLSIRGHMVKEIAWACGFENAAAFSAAFRRATGVTPREYREAAPEV